MKLKKLFILLIISLFFISCSQTIYIKNKEFVVKQIDGTIGKNKCEYILHNTKNKKVIFEDNINKYQIGDTLMLIRK